MVSDPIYFVVSDPIYFVLLHVTFSHIIIPIHVTVKREILNGHPCC